MAEPPPSGVIVQLVRAPDAGARRATRLGVGLLVSLVVGWPTLNAALAGVDFEASVIRFLAIVALSVGGALALGRLYDTFSEAGGPTSPAPATAPDHTNPEEQHR